MVERFSSVWPAERVIAHEQGVLVVDKPARVPVHGGAPDEESVSARLGRWLCERGQDSYLGIHQRLDAGVSGVLLFSRDPELNARLARDFEGHRAKKIYVAAVSGRAVSERAGLGAAGTLRHRLEGRPGRATKVTTEGGQLAVTHYRRLERYGERALFELEPETGRTHQLRVQLAHVGAPIAGDLLYGGEPAERLMLHAQALSLPSLGRSYFSPVPRDLVRWASGQAPVLGDSDEVRRKLLDALALRSAVAASATAFRLVNDGADALVGLAVDRYGDFAVLEPSSAEAASRTQELAARLVDLGARGVYLKRRDPLDGEATVDPAPKDPVLGVAAPPTLFVREGDLTFEVRLADGLATGLYVDQRAQRACVFRGSRGARVLNLFAYTCSFSVAAAKGGAKQVVSVDLSGAALRRGQQNFRLNRLDPARHGFEKGDVVDWLRRAVRRRAAFDLVILDPPSFSRSKHGTFKLTEDYVNVAAQCLRLLAPGGALLAVTHQRSIARAAFRRMLHEAGRRAGRALVRIKDLRSGADCPDLLGEPFPSKAALVELSTE